MKQQLLLLQDVDALGKKGDVVSAKSGYVRNFLIPQNTGGDRQPEHSAKTRTAASGTRQTSRHRPQRIGRSCQANRVHHSGNACESRSRRPHVWLCFGRRYCSALSAKWTSRRAQICAVDPSDQKRPACIDFFETQRRRGRYPAQLNDHSRRGVARHRHRSASSLRSLPKNPPRNESGSESQGRDETSKSRRNRNP